MILRTDKGGGVVRDGGNNGDTVVPAFNMFLFILSPNTSRWSPLFRKWTIVRLSYLPDRVPPRPMANGRKAVGSPTLRSPQRRISAPWKLGKKRVSQSSRQMRRNIRVKWGNDSRGERHSPSRRGERREGNCTDWKRRVEFLSEKQILFLFFFFFFF